MQFADDHESNSGNSHKANQNGITCVGSSGGDKGRDKRDCKGADNGLQRTDDTGGSQIILLSEHIEVDGGRQIGSAAGDTGHSDGGDSNRQNVVSVCQDNAEEAHHIQCAKAEGGLDSSEFVIDHTQDVADWHADNGTDGQSRQIVTRCDPFCNHSCSKERGDAAGTKDQQTKGKYQ